MRIKKDIPKRLEMSFGFDITVAANKWLLFCCACAVLLCSFFYNTLQYFIENPTILLRITAVCAVSSH